MGNLLDLVTTVSFHLLIKNDRHIINPSPDRETQWVRPMKFQNFFIAVLSTFDGIIP